MARQCHGPQAALEAWPPPSLTCPDIRPRLGVVRPEVRSTRRARRGQVADATRDSPSVPVSA